MDVHASLKALDTHFVDSLSMTKVRKITLYSSGTSAKLLQARYALRCLFDLSDKFGGTSTAEDEFTDADCAQFYTDAYFAFLYSAFDIFAHIINVVKDIKLAEDEVSFKKIKGKLKATIASDSLTLACDGIVRSNNFKNLEKYRNCSTHRRPIFLRHIETKISETPGYSATSPLVQTVHVLCDDPLVLNPKTIKRRLLEPYCKKLLEDFEKQIGILITNL